MLDILRDMLETAVEAQEATAAEPLQLTISELKRQLDQPHPVDLANVNRLPRTSATLDHQDQRELQDLQDQTEFQDKTESQDTTLWM